MWKQKKVDLGSSDYTTVAATILEGVGGAANVKVLITVLQDFGLK